MRYLVAPSAYKGSFSPAQIASAIRAGIERFDPESIIQLAPIADGGDGTIEALQVGTGGSLYSLDVNGPVGETVTANWLVIEKDRVPDEDSDFSFKAPEEAPPAVRTLAIAELASACGLAYIAPDRLAALDSNTIGVGQVLNHCHQLGYRNIVLAVGGSASTDGGTGILTALGARFLNSAGESIRPGGRHLRDIVSADLSALDQWRRGFKLRVATDVINPLLGENGAARIFAPQKGASVRDVEILEAGLLHYADVLETTTGKLARNLQGAGAAGGVPFGLAVAMDAEIIPGFRWIASILELEDKIGNCDVVISAEGKLDLQSISGKATGELARMCAKSGKRFWMVPAQLQSGIDWSAYNVERVLASASIGTAASLNDVSDATFQLCALQNS